MARREGARGGTGELLAVWGLLALDTLAVLVTYSRLPPSELYNVQEAGDLRGGLGRTLVLLNFPVAIAAIPLALLAGGRRALVAAAVGLCALTAVPGVVNQDDLDARPVNALPALGVAFAAGLAVAAARRRGVSFAPRAPGDDLRAVLAAALVLVSLPWIAAEAGFHFPGDVFLGEEATVRGGEGSVAVHLGFHHGWGGAMLALAALALSRVPAGAAVRALLSVMLSYGLANAAQDAWNEQLWKRGTVDWHAPSVLRPGLTAGWPAIVVGAAAAHALWLRPRHRG